MVLVECYDHICSSAASSMSSRVCIWVCCCHYVCMMVLSCFAYLICICVYIRCLIETQSEWWIITVCVYRSRFTLICIRCRRQVFIRVRVCFVPLPYFLMLLPYKWYRKFSIFIVSPYNRFFDLRAQNPLRK